MMRRVVLGLHAEGCAVANAASAQVAQFVPCLRKLDITADYACQGWSYGGFATAIA